MQEKQKVTLYLSPELHRQLKIRAAIDSEPMSEIAQRAIVFYLAHPEATEEIEALHGQTHRIYGCPECRGSLVIQEGELVSLIKQPGVLPEEDLSVEEVTVKTETDRQGEQELVRC